MPAGSYRLFLGLGSFSMADAQVYFLLQLTDGLVANSANDGGSTLNGILFTSADCGTGYSYDIMVHGCTQDALLMSVPQQLLSGSQHVLKAGQGLQLMTPFPSIPVWGFTVNNSLDSNGEVVSD